MCQCEKEQYCVGCGRFRELMARILLCAECYATWLAVTPARMRDRELMPSEEVVPSVR